MPGLGQCLGGAAASLGVIAAIDLFLAYFFVKTPKKAVSAGELGLPAPFAKLANMRDVAAGPGMTGVNGRKLRTGLIYRCAKLHGIPSSDLELLKKIGVRFVADFRSQGEAVDEPDAFADEHKVQHRFFEAADGDPKAAMTRFIREGKLSELQATEYMEGINKAFVTNHAGKFRLFLETLVETDGTPALVHCTAGKDRTGWAVALLLFTLGVDKDVVMQDYLLSNLLWYRTARKYMLMIRLFSGFRIRPKDALPLLTVRREYLEASVNTALASHGSIEKYLTAPDGLGLDAATIKKLQDVFLEEASASKM